MFLHARRVCHHELRNILDGFEREKGGISYCPLVSRTDSVSALTLGRALSQLDERQLGAAHAHEVALLGELDLHVVQGVDDIVQALGLVLLGLGLALHALALALLLVRIGCVLVHKLDNGLALASVVLAHHLEATAAGACAGHGSKLSVG